MPETFELLTSFAQVKLNTIVPIKVDAGLILEDFERVSSVFVGQLHSVREHHDGGWKSIALVASGGKVSEDRHINKVGLPYLATPALELCPYIQELLQKLPAQYKRVRFLSLEPNHEIKWHCDGTGTIDRIINSSSCRFHIPIITSSLIEFQICHNICHWQPGNMYYGDFSFPHRVKNNWDKIRIHLVIDLIPNNDLRSLFPNDYRQQEYRRFLLRKFCKKLYGRYWQKFQKFDDKLF